MKIYNVLFNSAISTTTTIEAKTYFFDWGKLEQGNYKVTFSFVTAPHTTTRTCANIFIDLGLENSYIAQGTSGTQLPTCNNFLGSVRATGIGANSQLFADSVGNPPVMIYNRPNQNQVTIRLLANDLVQTPYTPNVDYSLNMCLELIE